MNWFGEINLLLAFAGFTTASYACYKGGEMSLWMPLAFFSLVAPLQAFAQTVANQCGLPANQLVSLLGYLHFCFQPFFINALALHFIDKRVAARLDIYAYSICFTALTIMLIQIYPFTWAGHCAAGSVMCGEHICTMQDGWHMTWVLPITQFADEVPWYYICAFVMPVLYGSWRFMAFYMISCPMLAYLLTNNMNEWPMLASSLTVAFLLFIICSHSVRERMTINRWLGWRMLQAGY